MKEFVSQRHAQLHLELEWGDSSCVLAVGSIWQGLGSSEAPGRSSELVGGASACLLVGTDSFSRRDVSSASMVGWECLLWAESPSGRTSQHVVPALVTPVFPSSGNLCMVTGGANLGRIGVITNRERHPGSFDVVHVKDANGNSFATRLSNIFVIGKVRPGGTRWGVLSSCEGLLTEAESLGISLGSCLPTQWSSDLAPCIFPCSGKGKKHFQLKK